jgi:transcriptional regulator with XRE-family HTH domain
MAGRGKANHIDEEVGNRLRLRRTELGMSQEELGRRLKLTFQQIQKFESGSNRISASYLYEIAQILRVPVSYFFSDVSSSKRRKDMPVTLQKFLMSAEGLSLWRAFSKVDDDTVRQRVIALVKAVADEPANHPRH